MNTVLFDDDLRENLLPLTFTRPVAELRVGILTIAEKWGKRLNATLSYKTEAYLSAKYPERAADDTIFINGACLPSEALVQSIKSLEVNASLLSENGRLIAKRAARFDDESENETKTQATFINYPEDIFSLNGEEIEADYDIVTVNRNSQELSSTNMLLGKGRIFVEEGAKVEGAILNISNGSIYIGRNAEVMEGAIVRGGLALCDSASLKLGAKVYGPTTIGPHSKIGGEVNNCVIIGYTNKGHDGFLGNSVIGEWCNLGADTNNSNLKNNYADVKIWSYTEKRFRNTNKQFCGLIMGDHSKCGINTMFNTGTVVGVSANIFGSGFPRNYVPSFAWGGAAGYMTYQLKKAGETAALVYERRSKSFDKVEAGILEHIFNQTKSNRFWEK
ncbi:MAG: GlmU family protein [Bacteroidetes bacterium]|jgi:UDP-N-acetylglucosamine diphosphorylase/glucosamine-1-phosphate N-acetyltransferase|nr:GlmU family protein [Bacteroidota bacterium]